MLPAQLSRCHTGLMLLQYANDLLIAKSGSLHRLSHQLGNRQTLNRGDFTGARQDLSVWVAQNPEIPAKLLEDSIF